MKQRLKITTKLTKEDITLMILTTGIIFGGITFYYNYLDKMVETLIGSSILIICIYWGWYNILNYNLVEGEFTDD